MQYKERELLKLFIKKKSSIPTKKKKQRARAGLVFQLLTFSHSGLALKCAQKCRILSRLSGR